MTTEKQLPARAAYEIQTYTLCYGWLNTWTYEDSKGVTRPETFSTRQAAQEALDEALLELAEEYSLGNIFDYDHADFRIVQCLPGITTSEAGAA